MPHVGVSGRSCQLNFGTNADYIFLVMGDELVGFVDLV